MNRNLQAAIFISKLSDVNIVVQCAYLTLEIFIPLISSIRALCNFKLNRNTNKQFARTVQCKWVLSLSLRKIFIVSMNLEWPFLGISYLNALGFALIAICLKNR